MDFEDIFYNPGFYILVGVGYAAFFMMLSVLNKMGETGLMPTWVKMITMIMIPIIAAGVAGLFGD